MDRQRAVVVTPRLPWPLDDGGRVVLWQSLWSAAQAYRTTLVSLVAPDERSRSLPAELESLAEEVVRIEHRPPPTPVALARGALGRWPYTLARYRNRSLERTLERLERDLHPEFVLFNHLHLAPHHAALRSTAVVLRQHNVEHRWMARYAESLANPMARAYARLQAGRLRRAERRLCAEMDLVLAIQDEEAALLRTLAPRAHVEVVPIGIDERRFDPWKPESPPVVLIVGSLGWPPNAEGVVRFLEEGWPLVRASCSQARLRIVGRDAPPSLAQAARASRVELVGYVESVAPEFSRASALVVPLWVAAGARVKIVEALVAGLPVVSTSLGAEGLNLVPDEHFLERETPAALAEGILQILRDREAGEALSRHGQSHARSSYSLDSVARRTNQLCAAAAVHGRR